MGWIKDKLKQLFCVHSPSKEYEIIYRKGFKEFFRGYNEEVERVRKMQENQMNDLRNCAVQHHHKDILTTNVDFGNQKSVPSIQRNTKQFEQRKAEALESIAESLKSIYSILHLQSKE